MDIEAITQAVKAILTKPDVDLSLISSKRVRKELAESFGSSTVKENKEVGIQRHCDTLCTALICAISLHPDHRRPHY